MGLGWSSSLLLCLPARPEDGRVGPVRTKKKELLIWGVQKQFEGGLARASRVAKRARRVRRRIPPNEFGLYSWKGKKEEAHLALPKNEGAARVWAVFGYRIIFRMQAGTPRKS